MNYLTRQILFYSAIILLIAGLSGCSSQYSGNLQGTQLQTGQLAMNQDEPVFIPVQHIEAPVAVVVSSRSQNTPVKLQTKALNLPFASKTSAEIQIVNKTPQPVMKKVSHKIMKKSQAAGVPNSLTAAGLIMGFTGMAIAMIFGFFTTPLIGEPEFLIMMLGVGIGFFGAFATVLGIAVAKGDIPPVQQESIDETPVTPEPAEDHHDHKH